jgi:hypothetical protein
MTSICGGSGWVMTAAQLFTVVNDLANGNTLLTPAEKTDMNTGTTLGWDNTNRSDCPNPYPCKNGGLDGGSSGKDLFTYIGIYQGAVPVVLLVNSPLPAAYQPWDQNGNSYPGGHADIIDLVADAWDASIVPPPPACNATTDCTGTVAITCEGDNAFVSFYGNCQLGNEPVACAASCSGNPCTLDAGGNVYWIGSTTSINTVTACTQNPAGYDCIPVVATQEKQCPPNSGPPPLCNSGYTWCTRFTPPECVPVKVCLHQPIVPPPP